MTAKSSGPPIVGLLAIIALAVGYLAISDYHDRQRMQEVAEAISDPDGYAAEQWAEQANMDCWLYSDVVTATTNGGVLRPMEFTCMTDRAGNYRKWRVRDRPCVSDEVDLWPAASGAPSSDKDLFKPYYSICWSVSQLPPASLTALQN